MDIDLCSANKELSTASARDILQWCYAHFPADGIKFSTSFGAEGMVLLHMLVDVVKTPRVFFIDTGRNYQETYDLWQRVVDAYGITIESYAPDPEDLAALQHTAGPNLFFLSVEQRKQCCFVRKVKPLQRALEDAAAWLAPLRRSQSQSRADVEIISLVSAHGVYKICPLANWSEDDVWEYIRNNAVPYHSLYDKGYPSIGCAPCSRPVRPAEAQRASRWWWEQDSQKECGIHIEDGAVKRREGGTTYTI